jgi:CRISPR-associated protein Csb2
MKPTVGRYSVTSFHPLRLTETIILADQVHTALVNLSNGSSIFTGCDKQGRPLQGNKHAHVFCESHGPLEKNIDGKITHIIIYAPIGFDSGDLRALQHLNLVWNGRSIRVRLLLQGIGQAEDFGGLDIDRGQSPLLGESRVWLSRTPFLPTRYAKITRAGVPKLDERGLQIGSPEHELRRLIGLAGFPEPIALEPISCTWLGGREVPWRSYCRRRLSGGGKQAGIDGYGFRIEFSEAVRGPLALGYGAHFGMGVFVPEK